MSDQEIEERLRKLRERKAKLEELKSLEHNVTELEAELLLSPLPAIRASNTVATIVADNSDLPLAALVSRTRRQDIADARMIVFYFLRRYAGLRVGKIARIWKRDHGTVTHAERAVSDLMSVDTRFKSQIENLSEIIVPALKQLENQRKQWTDSPTKTCDGSGPNCACHLGRTCETPTATKPNN